MTASDPIAGYRPPFAATGHMPFVGHRTQKEVREGVRHKRNHKLGRTCSSCPAPISDASTTGLCKPCFMRASNVDPALRKRRGETLSRRCRTDAELMAVKCSALATARARRDPEAMRERGRRLALAFPAYEEKRRTAHRKAMRRLRHAWLPDEWRPTYRKMLRSCGYGAPEAKAIILAHIREESARLNDPAIGSRRLAEAIRRVHV